jgi:hypothetical protein
MSRTWPVLVFLMLTAALSVAVAEDYNNVNAGAETAPAADPGQTPGIQPLGMQPAEQMRAPAEAPSSSEQEQQAAAATPANPDQNANPNANQ